MGRPAPFKPTEEHRREVLLMAGFGLNHDQIAVLLKDQNGAPIGPRLLRAHFDHELKSGAAMVNAKVVESLYKKAIGNGPQAVTACIWWTKARMGWRSTDVIAHVAEGSNGVLVVPAQVTPEDWIEEQQHKNAKKAPPNKPK